MIIQPMVIDIYHGEVINDRLQGAYNFGIRGVIHKATEGRTVYDKTYNDRREMAAERGMLWGAYHFLRPGDITQQVDWFLKHAKPDENTLLALDHEDARIDLDEAIKFMKQIESKAGRKPILYSGFLIKQQIDDNDEINDYLKTIRLWLCQYGPKPTWPEVWTKPWLWQFTGDGSGPAPHNIDGIKIPGGKGIDINSFEGDENKLRSEWIGTNIKLVDPSKPKEIKCQKEE